MATGSRGQCRGGPRPVYARRATTQAVSPRPLPNQGINWDLPFEEDPLTPAFVPECRRSVFIAAGRYTFLPKLMSYPAGMGLCALCSLSYGVYFISILVKLKETDSDGLSPPELME